MQRKFITNLAFLFFLNLLIKPLWIFGIDRTVQNVTGAENYGIYFALFNFSYLFSILLDLGITYFNNRTISQQQHLLSDYLPSILTIKFMLTFLYTVFTFSIAFWLNFNSYQMKLLFFLVGNQVLVSLIMYLRSNISALQYFKTDSMLSVLDKVLMLIFCGILLWGNFSSQPITIELYIYAQTLAYGITAIICWILVLKFVKKISFKWNSQELMAILKQSYPFAILILLMTIYNRVDAVMLERMLKENGAREAGIYASAYRIIDAVNMIGFLFAALLLPMFSRMLKQKEAVDDLVQLGFKLIFVFASCLGIACYFFQNEIMRLLYHEASAYSGQIFGLLMFAFIGTANVYIFGTLLTANNNLKILNWIAVSGVLLNVLLNLWLIPRYNALGAAIAATVTQLIVSLIHTLAAQSLFKFKINWKLLLTLFFYSVSAIVVGKFVKNLSADRQDIFAGWQMNFLLCIVLFLLMALLVKLIDLKKIFLLYKRVQQ